MKQDKILYTHGEIINIYIVYELTGSNSVDNEPTVRNSLFGAVTLTKNIDIDKNQYSGYGILDLIEEEVFISSWLIW